MRFKNFIKENAGYFDDKRDAFSFGANEKPQPAPTQMTLGQSEAQGTVTGITTRLKTVVINLDLNGKKGSIEVPLERYEREPVNPGDIVRAVMNQDGTTQDYQRIHSG